MNSTLREHTIAGPRWWNFQGALRYKFLSHLQANPTMNQREMSDALGVSPGGVVCCLKALLNKGLDKRGDSSAAPNKPRYSHILIRKVIVEQGRLARRFLKWKMGEYETLRAEMEVDAERASPPAKET